MCIRDRPYKLTKKNKKKYVKAYAAKAKFGSKTVKVTFKNVTGYASYKVQMKAGKAAYKTVKKTTKGGTITYTCLLYTSSVYVCCTFIIIGV